METNHKRMTLDDFKIIGKGYKRSKFRSKLAESLYIKEKCSSLNTPEACFPRKLFNQRQCFNATDSDLFIFDS